MEENKERSPPLAPLRKEKRNEEREERTGEIGASIRSGCVRCYSINEKGRNKTRASGGFAEGVCERGWVGRVRVESRSVKRRESVNGEKKVEKSGRNG